MAQMTDEERRKVYEDAHWAAIDAGLENRAAQDAALRAVEKEARWRTLREAANRTLQELGDKVSCTEVCWWLCQMAEEEGE